jgi:predicted SnoaL-like aldol condensation-catalyzing enzyme
VRAFEDDDFVFGHTEYYFASRRIGFEVFRFEDGHAVEHWDNIQARKGPNAAGRNMVDGPVEATDLDLTEQSRDFVRSFVETVLVGGRLNQLAEYIDAAAFADHNPRLAGDVTALRAALEAMKDGGRQIDFQKVHRVLAEGSFVLCVSEGNADGVHSAFYDLFRVAGGKLVERWDTTEKIAPRSECKTTTGSSEEAGVRLSALNDETEPKTLNCSLDLVARVHLQTWRGFTMGPRYKTGGINRGVPPLQNFPPITSCSASILGGRSIVLPRQSKIRRTRLQNNVAISGRSS